MHNPIFLSTVPPTATQRVIATALSIAMLLIVLLTIPFAHYALPVIQNFSPVVDAMFGSMLLTITFILLGQFLRLRTWSLMTLTTAFFLKAVLVLLHLVSYPGFFLQDGLGDGINDSGWVYLIWHISFPLMVITYAYLHGRKPRRQIPIAPHVALGLSFGAVLLFAASFVAFLVQWGDLLPQVSGDNALFFVNGGGLLAMLLLDGLALLLVWNRSDSVLDLWLWVSVWAVTCSIAMVGIDGHRYQLSFYVAWLFELFSAMTILAALMEEMNRLYASLFAIMQEQQLRNMAEYRSVVDTAIDAIIVIDERGSVHSFNRAAEVMFGYAATEVLGQNVKMLMPEPYHSEHDQYLRNYLTTGVRKVIGIGREVQAKSKNDRVFPIELAVTEWKSGDDRRFTGIVRDVSERKRIEQQLVQSQKMEAIGQLTGGMAHDFNNLLGVVIGNLDMLSDHFPDEKPIELKDAIESASTGADLVRRLLAFARRQPLLPKPMQMDKVVETLLPLVRRTIGDKVVIETSYDADLLPVLADPTQFENALLNLIINARDAMPRGGRLQIFCRNTVVEDDLAEQYDVTIGHYTTLIVRDNGIGIPKDILPHVIEPFYTTKEPGMGSGLGLSMVFGYAKQSGGVLRLYSEVGRGTEVRVHLPSIITDATNDERKATPVLTDLGGTERILVVEDTAMARAMVLRMLNSLGYLVRVANDATEATLMIDSGETFDLLFTDIVMPGPMDGIELARYVRERDAEIKILFTSGFSNRPSEDVGQVNAWYISKPYRKMELAQTLRMIFASK